MLEDGSIDDSEVFGLEDPVCIDGVIFYGPITDRERIVKERFERRQKERLKTQFLPAPSNKDFPETMIMVSKESKNELNDSIYESFSIDESKYESFNDSLDERKFFNPTEVNVSKFSAEYVNVSKRKFHGKQIPKGSMCDSLEDIHSLVSNIDKLSISEEIENINVHERTNIYDDSLKNDICLENKNFSSADQNFDDDSLAILDFEKAFDDSLEEADFLSLSQIDNVVMLRNGENTEVSVENLAKENAVSKNLFETSVEVIYENAGYFENSDEGNAEFSKQLSLTADSLSISENISKDSLNHLPSIPKYLEQKAYKKSLSSLNQGKSDTSTNSNELGYYDNMINIRDKDSNLESKQNSSHNVNERFVNIKKNTNDTIVIEDSFIKSPEATAYIKREDSMKSTISINQHEREFSLQINNSFCKHNCIKLSSYSNSNVDSSLINNHVKISDESNNKRDIHPNDTICIDDSFILPKSTSLIEDEMHLTITPISENQKVNQEINFIDDSNDTIFVPNSTLSTLNIKDKHAPSEKKCMNSELCIQTPIKLEPENLETGIHPNDTICIDNSLNLSQNASLDKNELHSFKVSESQENDEQILSSKKSSPPYQKLNDTSNNSFTISPPPLLNKKARKGPSSLKRKKEKSIQGKDSKSFIQSPVKHHLKHLEKTDEAGVSNPNDTICIDSSPVEPLKIKVEKSPFTNDSSKKSDKKPVRSHLKHSENEEVGVPNSNDTIYIDNSPIESLRTKMDKSLFSNNNYKKNDTNPFQAKSTDSKFHIQSPVKHHVRNLGMKKEKRISNFNKSVDSSPVDSLKITTDKKSIFSNKSSKVQSSGFKNNALNEKELISCEIAKVHDSSFEDFSKDSISNNIVKDPNNVIDYFKDALVLPKELPKDNNLKLQLEVVFDENQGVNIISVSTVNHCPKNITPTVTKVDSRRVIVGIANQSPNLTNVNQGASALRVNEKICENNIVSDETIYKGCSSDVPEAKSIVSKSYPEKNKIDCMLSNDANEHNAQLLEALDLHDISCSFVDNGFLQSRDSIMPLNLCIRSRSPEINHQYITKTESKENVPFFDKELVSLADHSKSKRSSTKALNKTPKHHSNMDDKNSASKTNSTTKIPIRKIDNLHFTPAHQKVSKDIKAASTERIFKSPLVKSISAIDNLTSVKSEETPRKHHFCSVRNSVSRVPKSTPRSIPKRFQNIESPIAKYIGKPQLYTPLKTTHRYDGNLILGNAVKTNRNTIKTPNSACKASPQCSSAGKL